MNRHFKFFQRAFALRASVTFSAIVVAMMLGSVSSAAMASDPAKVKKAMNSGAHKISSGETKESAKADKAADTSEPEVCDEHESRHGGHHHAGGHDGHSKKSMSSMHDGMDDEISDSRYSPLLGPATADLDKLTPEQRIARNKIQDEFRKQRWSISGKLLDEYAALRDLYDEDKRDPKAIGAQYGRVFDLRRQMIELSLEMHNRMEEAMAAAEVQK